MRDYYEDIITDLQNQIDELTDELFAERQKRKEIVDYYKTKVRVMMWEYKYDT